MTNYQATKLEMALEAARDEWLESNDYTAGVREEPTYTWSDDAEWGQ